MANTVKSSNESGLLISIRLPPLINEHFQGKWDCSWTPDSCEVEWWWPWTCTPTTTHTRTHTQLSCWEGDCTQAKWLVNKTIPRATMNYILDTEKTNQQPPTLPISPAGLCRGFSPEVGGTTGLVMPLARGAAACGICVASAAIGLM